MPLHEACGVVGIIRRTPVLTDLEIALRALQHRGQESAGITMFDGKHETHKGMGLVSSVFSEMNNGFGKGNSGIGHVRYSTAGGSTIRNAQPVLLETESGEFSLAHNGTISNHKEIREMVDEETLKSDTDSEIVLKIISQKIENGTNAVNAIRETMKILVGSYSITMMHDDKMYAFRDPLGIKPLAAGCFDDGYIIASESSAMDTLGASFDRDIQPGEIVEMDADGITSHGIDDTERKAFCMFEYVYFARADAKMDGILAYSVRHRLGQQLWKEHPAEADIVIAVPDSGTAFALGYSEASEIPYREGFIKNRYVGRSFIQPDDIKRKNTVNEKMNPVGDLLDGKRVVVVDDSVVRGNTSRKIVSRLREAGAKEVHFRVGCPPIISPCYLGIDMPTREEFVATGKEVEDIRAEIGADSMGYVSISGLVDCIGKEEKQLCLGCIDEHYPVPIEGEKLRE